MSRPFSFKRFTVTQERAAMKVGTDGVLLGAWCSVLPSMARALDIGTGTGLIALMLAQRSENGPMTVEGIEPQEGGFTDAAANAAASPWAERIMIRQQTLQQFAASAPGPYDLIVCNPPYFVSSLRPPVEARSMARHATLLDREELVRCAAAMSREGTLLAVIVPFGQAGGYEVSGDLAGFTLTRRTDIRPTPGSDPKRTLLEFTFRTPPAAGGPERSELTIQYGPETFTEEYKKLTGDFYLKF